MTVEDVDVAAWASLMTMVMIRGTQLKKLSIEAVPTMEAFESSFDTSAILALLPLQHLRLDGISFGGGIVKYNIIFVARSHNTPLSLSYT